MKILVVLMTLLVGALADPQILYPAIGLRPKGILKSTELNGRISNMCFNLVNFFPCEPYKTADG